MEKTYCPTAHLNGFEVKGQSVRPEKVAMASLYGRMSNHPKDNFYNYSKEPWRDRNERNY